MAGRGNPFAVLVAVVIGIPLYSNAAGVIPLVSELTRAGVAMGTALAFMMAVTGLSLPEMILLRRVLKPKLLAVFIAIVGMGIVFTGYLFNFCSKEGNMWIQILGTGCAKCQKLEERPDRRLPN